MESSGQPSSVPSVYQVHRSIPHGDIVLKNKCPSGEPLIDCKMIGEASKGKTRKVTLENASSSQTVELNSDIPLDGLLPTVGNRSEPGSIVIGEPVQGCVMVDLPDSVVKDGTSVQVQSVPYLIDQQVLVQVSGEEPRIEVQAPRTSDLVSVYVKSGQGSSSAVADIRNSLEVASNRCLPVEQPNSSDSNHVKPGLIESRFVFQDLSRDEFPTISLSEGSQKENFDIKLENEDDSSQVPRRKSARRARLKWKSLEEEDNVIRRINFLKKRKHYPLSPSDKGKVFNNLKPELPLVEVPVWAQYLTSVRVIDGKWIYGIASSKAILHQALEGHSRSILCDYIKSHPCNFEKRRNARSQECRIMWQHKRVMFDGVPFIIASSEDLKCTFGMNYKFKKKKSDEIVDISVPDEFMNEGDRGKSEETSNRVEEKKTKVSRTPKKAYKDVMFTSCPAKITVKVIVKYPGYAVHPLSFPAERKVRLKALRTALSKKSDVEKEELYYVTLPLGSAHNHEFTGRSRNIHPSIIAKVKELVHSGITAPKVIKKLLDSHVQIEHGHDVVTPHPDDRAYYPKVKDIGNLVYNYCKKMGISSKRKSVGAPAEVLPGKKRHHKSLQSEENNEECCNSAITDNLPLQASTLQEAVQTFCTDEPDRGNVSVGGEQECNPVTAVMSNTSSEVASLAEMVRGQLDSLRNITYSLTEASSLQELYQSLQGILTHYTPVNQQILQGSLGNGTAPTAAFIIHESVIDPLAVGEDSLQVGVSEAIPTSLTVPVRDTNSIVTTAKFRNAQIVENAHLRQFKPPVALQCLATNVVPTLTMSHLPRSSNPVSEQGPAHIVTSLPSNSTASPAAVSITQPTYQAVAPVSQDASAVPVQLSLPPYFYYVQEVTVPESSAATPSLNAR